MTKYANSHPFKVAQVKDEGFYANSHPYQVAVVEGGTGGEARVVDELPEIGEVGYIYLVLKETTSSGDIYDEYIWALQEDGETYAWEHLGATNEVTITLYDSTGQNTDGAMTQKAASNMIYPSGYETSKNKIAMGPYIGSTNNRVFSVSTGDASKQRGVYGGATTYDSIAILGETNGYRNVVLGSYANTYGTENIVIGYEANSGGSSLLVRSVALGAYSTIGRSNEVSVGSGTDNDSMQPKTRYIANVRDPQLAQDAATKNYVDTAIAGVGVNSITNEDWNTLWQ